MHGLPTAADARALVQHRSGTFQGKPKALKRAMPAAAKECAPPAMPAAPQRVDQHGSATGPGDTQRGNTTGRTSPLVVPNPPLFARIRPLSPLFEGDQP